METSSHASAAEEQSVVSPIRYWLLLGGFLLMLAPAAYFDLMGPAVSRAENHQFLSSMLPVGLPKAQIFGQFQKHYSRTGQSGLAWSPDPKGVSVRVKMRRPSYFLSTLKRLDRIHGSPPGSSQHLIHIRNGKVTQIETFPKP